MRNLVLVFCLSIFIISCNGQEKSKTTYPKEKIMNTERFDIQKYRKRQLEKEKTGNLSNCEDTLSDNTIINYSSSIKPPDKLSYSITITPPPPALFFTVKNFYDTGIIKEETKSFIGFLMIEPFYNSLVIKKYDEKGYLIKTIDNSNFNEK